MKKFIHLKSWSVFRVFAVFLFLVSIGLAVIPICSLRIDNRFEIWFYTQDPAIQSYEKGHQEFGDWNWMSVYLTPKDSIYSTGFLTAVATITDKIKTLPDVRKVISLTNAKGNRIDNDELSYQPILAKAPWADSDVVALKNTLESNLIYRNGLVKPGNDKSTLVLVQVNNRDNDKEAYRVKLVDAVEGLASEQSAAVADYAIAGSPFLNAELNRSSHRDMLVFYPLVSLLVTLITWLIFRNLRDIAIVLLSLTGATVWSVGLMMTQFDLNMVTIMMPTILVTVAVANVMHFIVTFHLKRKEHSDWDAEKMAKSTLKELWVPALGTTTSTACGFLSLTQTGILPVTLLGYYAAAGIMFAYLITITIVPVMLTLFWGDMGKSEEISRQLTNNALINKTSWSGIYEKTSFKHPYLIFSLFVLFSGAVLFNIDKLDADTDYVNLFHEKTQVKQFYHKVENEGYATNSFTLLVHASQGLEEKNVFPSVLALEKKIEALPKVRNIASPTKLIEEVDRALAEDKKQWQPGLSGYGREAVAQLILTAEISGNDDLADMMTKDHRDFQLTVFTDYMSSREVAKFASEVEALAKAQLPNNVEISVTGLPVLWGNMASQLLASQSSILLSLIAPLFFIMLGVVRSVRLVLIGLVVNLLPVALILGIMAWVDIKIDMATVLIGGITMGIAVDDTIHFLWQFRSGLLQGKNLSEAAKITFNHTGTAILMTAFLLSSGFLVMAVSDFTPTSNFGWLTSLTVVIALITEIFLMPTLLVLFVPRAGLSGLSFPAWRQSKARLENQAQAQVFVKNESEKDFKG